MQKEDISILIPRLLRRVRLEKKISQEDLADLAGLDRTYISAVERSRRNVTIKSLSKILGALNLDTIQFAKQLIYESQSDKS